MGGVRGGEQKGCLGTVCGVNDIAFSENGSSCGLDSVVCFKGGREREGAWGRAGQDDMTYGGVLRP